MCPVDASRCELCCTWRHLLDCMCPGMLHSVTDVVHSDIYLTRCVLEMLVHGKCCTWQHLLRLGVPEILHGVTDVHGNTYLTRCILEMLQGETDDVHGDTYLIRCVPQMFQAVTHAAHADLPNPHSVLSNLMFVSIFQNLSVFFFSLWPVPSPSLLK